MLHSTGLLLAAGHAGPGLWTPRNVSCKADSVGQHFVCNGTWQFTQAQQRASVGSWCRLNMLRLRLNKQDADVCGDHSPQREAQ
jgi:hypothetical protein